jgi:hypothetical protein
MTIEDFLFGSLTEAFSYVAPRFARFGQGAMQSELEAKSGKPLMSRSTFSFKLRLIEPTKPWVHYMWI